ncbi:outer membrane beta-barrel protein [Falsiporphyromonas endometrii]|uniref:outer membrane beta-barrel protein n=1 Tax=Falsiporphyromonas endometrii TaxID=1387297 RepID=UPI0036D3F7BF
MTGGSFGVNTQNALTTGLGNDIINGRYNFGNTQIGLTYHISYRNYSKRILDEMMRYKPKDQYIEKDKKGHKSPYAYEDQTIELNLTNSKAKSYVSNTKLSLSSFDRRRTSTQDISFIKGELTAQKRAFSRDNDSYIKPVADIYYNKLFGQKHEITLNAVGTYFKTKYDYAYNEQSDKTEHFNTATNIRTDKYSLIGDFLYNLKLKQNQVFVGARYMYSHSKQEDLPKPNNITENELYCFSGVTGMLGNKISYNASIGLSNNHFNTLLDQSFDYTYFRPEVRLSYFIDESSECNLNYEINTNTPSIGQLTNNPYYKGQNYIFVGNTNLNPNNRHHISLSYFKGIKKFVINAETSFDHASKPIAPVFKTNNTDIIETFDNIDYSNMAKASLFLQWYPLNGNLLRLRIYSEVYHQQNKLDNEKWSYTDYMVAPSIKINYKKWSFETCFQSARTSLDGQIKREVSSLFYSELSYRPIKNMNITAGLRYPFYDGTSTKYKTTGTNLISRTESELIKSNANMVYINFAYNFTFGKSKPNVKLKMNNQDNDSGVLNRDN